MVLEAVRNQAVLGINQVLPEMTQLQQWSTQQLGDFMDGCAEMGVKVIFPMQSFGTGGGGPNAVDCKTRILPRSTCTRIANLQSIRRATLGRQRGRGTLGGAGTGERLAGCAPPCPPRILYLCAFPARCELVALLSQGNGGRRR